MSTHAVPLGARGETAAHRRPITRSLQILSMTPDQVENLALPIVRRGHRYRMDQVDSLLSQIAESMRTDPKPIHVTRPKTAGIFSPGYDAERVDRLLKRLRAQGALTF